MDTIALVPNNSLITETPEEGRQLAVKLARLIIKLTQPDEEKRKQLRDVYGNDAMMLIAIGQTVATEFATIAAANNYWQVRWAMNDYCLVDWFSRPVRSPSNAAANLSDFLSHCNWRNRPSSGSDCGCVCCEPQILKLKDGLRFGDRLISVNGNPTRFARVA